MSKKDKKYKAKTRREAENARKETAAMIKRMKKDLSDGHLKRSKDKK